jgi:ribosome-associated heat shock protein Hsp15
VTSGGGAQRLDRWLWCARLFRTRQAASAFIQQSSVRLTRDKQVHRIEKPGFTLRLGDEIAFVLGENLMRVRVTGFSDRRRSTSEAAYLLERIDH